MPVYAEGRVEHQKLNQTTALLLFGWVFGVQLDYSLWLKSVSATAGERVINETRSQKKKERFPIKTSREVS